MGSRTTDCFGVVDYHASPCLRAGVAEVRSSTAVYMLSAGLDPSKVTLFVQSNVPALATRLDNGVHRCLWWLSGMTQFKKSEGKSRFRELLPTRLMAADILLYDSDAVRRDDRSSVGSARSCPFQLSLRQDI